jgi:hypothetical protein
LFLLFPFKPIRYTRRYPPTYIDTHFKNFFAKFPSTTLSSILPLIHSENEFFAMRKQLLDRPTADRNKLEKSVQNADKEHGATSTEPQKQINQHYSRRLILHSTHEHRLQAIKRDFHQIWSTTFAATPVMETKVIVGNRNRRNAKLELIQTRPKASLIIL